MANQPDWYGYICWGFGVCFLFVFAGLFLFPELISGLVNIIGEQLGFAGSVDVNTNSIDYILSLSLMAVVTYLAFSSGANPRNEGTFQALMVAKVVSTLGFFWFTFKGEPIWIVPAIADGSVVVSLGVARRYAESPRTLLRQ